MTDNAWQTEPREEDEIEPTKTDVPSDGPALDEPEEEEN